MLIMSVTLLVTGCRSEDDGTNGADMKVVENVNGTVNFNSNYNLWYISVGQKGSYDDVTQYYPTNLDVKYQEVNKIVIFSGKKYPMTQQLVVPAGTKYYAIDIVKIKAK